MKIQFDANLDYQRDAIESVTGVFAGQEICQTNFTVAPLDIQETSSLFQDSLGIGNRLRLLDEDIHANIRKIQLKNGLAPSELFDSKDGINLTVEMETGTGKTYVYLRTIFEMTGSMALPSLLSWCRPSPLRKVCRSRWKLRRLTLKNSTKTWPSTTSPTIPVSCRMCATLPPALIFRLW